MQNLEQRQVRSRFLAITAGLKLVRHLVAFVQTLQARLLDSGDVDESVFATSLRRDKAEAFSGIEEFYGASSGHGYRSAIFGSLLSR